MATDCYLPSVTQGTSWNRVVTWDDSTGEPLDISGYTGRMQFRKGSSLVLELSSVLGGVSVGTTDGQVTLSMDPSQTADLPEGTLSFGLVMTSPTGVVTELLTGALAVLPARVFGDSPPDDFPALEAKIGIPPITTNGAVAGNVIDLQGYGPTLVAVVSRGTSANPSVNVTMSVWCCDDQLSWEQIGDEVTTIGPNSVASGRFTRSARYVQVRAELNVAASVYCSAVVLAEPL